MVSTPPLKKRRAQHANDGFWEISGACRPADIFNLPITEDVFLVDTRSSQDFSKSSLLGARSLARPAAAAATAGRELIEYVDAWVSAAVSASPPEYCVRAGVLGDPEIDAEENKDVLLAVERAIEHNPVLGNSVRRIYSLPAGHASVLADYPFLSSVALDRLTFYPCHVQPFLFIGSSMVASSKKAVEDLQIEAVLNTALELPNYHEGTAISYMKVPFEDDPDQGLADGLADALPFMARHITADRRILVHCHQGLSRSAAVVVAYLMASRGCGYFRAIDVLRRARPSVQPNLGFELELKHLEGKLIYEGPCASLGICQ